MNHARATHDDDDEPPVGERTTGLVVRLIEEKGFGFVRAESGHEYFFHMSNCVGDSWSEILDGWRNRKSAAVSFEPSTTSKGLRALMVRVEG